MGSYVLTRLGQIQKELRLLRTHVKQRDRRRPRTIEGLWKGVVVTEEDFERAKRSLFRDKGANGERK